MNFSLALPLCGNLRRFQARTSSPSARGRIVRTAVRISIMRATLPVNARRFITPISRRRPTAASFPDVVSLLVHTERLCLSTSAGHDKLNFGFFRERKRHRHRQLDEQLEIYRSWYVLSRALDFHLATGSLSSSNLSLLASSCPTSCHSLHARFYNDER